MRDVRELLGSNATRLQVRRVDAQHLVHNSNMLGHPSRTALVSPHFSRQGAAAPLMHHINMHHISMTAPAAARCCCPQVGPRVSSTGSAAATPTAAAVAAGAQT